MNPTKDAGLLHPIDELTIGYGTIAGGCQCYCKQPDITKIYFHRAEHTSWWRTITPSGSALIFGVEQYKFYFTSPPSLEGQVRDDMECRRLCNRIDYPLPYDRCV